MTATFRALACGLLLLAFPITAAGPREPVAIIYQISGEALRIAPGRSPEPLRLFDHLPAKTAVELAPGSRLAMAFITGIRYEISGPARVTLGTGDLVARSGGVRSLPTVPPLPLLPAITEEERPGPKAGAVRIRGEEIDGLYPGRGATALASAAVLRFRAVAGAGRYGIKIEDARGTVVYSTETESTRVDLPADALRPGRRYHWRVRTVDRSGPMARGEAEFATLDEEAARAREELRRLAVQAGDGELILLLAGTDQGLGLFAEARAELRSVRRTLPENTPLAETLNAFERRMTEEGFAPED